MSAVAIYLTIEEAAEVARAPVGSVRDWIRRGKLPASRPGRRVLIRRDRLLAFLDGAPLVEAAPAQLPAPAPPTSTRTALDASRAARRARPRSAGKVAP